MLEGLLQGFKGLLTAPSPLSPLTSNTACQSFGFFLKLPAGLLCFHFYLFILVYLPLTSHLITFIESLNDNFEILPKLFACASQAAGH